jgi:HSP20 family protein
MEVLVMFSSTPVTPFVNLRQAMDQLLNDSFVGGSYRTLWSRNGNGTGQGATAYPLPIDVYATGDEVVIVAAVPGMQPDNLDISFHQGTVVLSGTVGNVAESEQGKNATWYVHELWSGSFRRAVTLPFEVDADKANATWENGIVRLTLPKAERARPKKIAIQVGGRTEAIAASGTSES